MKRVSVKQHSEIKRPDHAAAVLFLAKQERALFVALHAMLASRFDDKRAKKPLQQVWLT